VLAKHPPSSTPVAIAGGGPVGLALAVELAYHGVASVVLERRDHVSWLRPRAKTTSARTMEHFRRWGIAEEVRRRAPLKTSWSDEAIFCTQLLGREITRIRRCFGLDLTGSDLVAEAGQQVPQPIVEQVLRDTIAASSLAQLVTGIEVTAAGQDADAAWVEFTDRSCRSRRIEAEYVVGCEGARSSVRHAIGARYEGSADDNLNTNITFRAPGLAEQVPFGPAVHYWVLHPEHPGLLGRLDLHDTWWVIVQGPDAAIAATDPARHVLERIGTDIPIEVLATDSWKARMLLADRYQSGRLFIAGDAAHQNPPWGGHGFNTGIGDAVNLGWKLAAVHRQWAPVALLDSYETERRPVAARTIHEAAANMAVLAPHLADPLLHGTPSQFAAAVRSVAGAIHTAKDSEFHSLPLTLGYHYAGSPIVSAEPTQSDRAPDCTSPWAPSAAPGHRLPHHWVDATTSIYDLLGPELTLLGDITSPSGRALVATARRLNLPLTTVSLTPAEASARYNADIVLVRPDQHVAWRRLCPRSSSSGFAPGSTSSSNGVPGHSRRVGRSTDATLQAGAVDAPEVAVLRATGRV
jgi:2-polyprenyl-6-methoxyphenol hydroxylase-like FAD-dependent oxidoreductase